MGCCLSSGKVTAPPVAVPIPPPIEEESVKEVVVQSVSVSVPDPKPVHVPDLVPSAPEVSDSQAQQLPPLPLPTPEVSHNKSDTCSISHSFSTATTATAASILEDDAVSKPHRPPPPPISRRNRPDRVSRSLGERHSPQGKLRPRLVRERPNGQPNLTHNRRNVDTGPLPRSGLLEGPRRRSRSPATRVPSSAGRSPMKKREGAKERDGGGAKEKNGGGATEKDGGGAKEKNGGAATEKDGGGAKEKNGGAATEKDGGGAKEEEAKLAVDVKKEDVAAKDPEVSMECFIFL